MFRHRKSKTRPLSSPDGLTPKATDAEIAPNQEPSEATQENSQAVKKLPTPTLSQIVDQKRWENEQLTQKLTYQQRKHGASMYFLEKIKLAVDSLQLALINFQNFNSRLDGEIAEKEN
jgi:hypothetical protein